MLHEATQVSKDAKTGENLKIQNNVSVYHGITNEDGVFVGLHVCFANDKKPRAINPDGLLKATDDWKVSATPVGYGSSIGANSTIIPGIKIGKFAMVGAGAPAKHVGYVCKCGGKLVKTEDLSEGTMYCNRCRKAIKVK